jgi:hypothetical protein
MPLGEEYPVAIKCNNCLREISPSFCCVCEKETCCTRCGYCNTCKRKIEPIEWDLVHQFEDISGLQLYPR